MRWFRLYHSVMHSRRLRPLSESAQLDFFLLLCAAGEHRESSGDQTGSIGMDVPHATFHLRRPALKQTAEELLNAGLIALNTAGQVRIVGWEERQFASDDQGKRVANWRARKAKWLKDQAKETSNVASNVTVTLDVTATDTEADTEADTDKPKSRASPARAARLPTDWFLPEEWKAWAVKVHHLDPQKAVRISLAFRDYWHAKPGKDGCKLDWFATWRNWIRKECGE